jgi:RNA polymerase sigma-70 factor (ECF subfamily)
MRLTVDQKTQHLVTLAQEGDESALNQLCKVYWSRVLWIVRLRMGKELRSKLESIDLVQDVLMCVFRDLKGFTYRSEGDFLRWLSRLVENRLRGKVTKLHAGKRDIRKEVLFDSHEQTTAGGFVGNAGPIEATTPSVIMSKREDLARLEKAIDVLKPEYREIIVLTKIEGLSYKEIADRLGKSDEAVRKQVSRALEALIGIFENI